MGSRKQIPAVSDQVADSMFVPVVEVPTYVTDHPHVVIDEAHNNWHKAAGRYKPFADLLRADGYRVSSNRNIFTPSALTGIDVLVISNAAGGTHEDDPDSIQARQAFTDQEIVVLREWVAGGGALLLVADHAPAGAAAMALGAAFGVEMRNSWTFDENHGEPGYGKYNLAFTRSNGLLGEHAITRGRNDAERINKVVSFTGQSLKGPARNVPLLILSDSAIDEDVTETIHISAAGRVQGLALNEDNGRLVVLGEAAMLTAQQHMRNGELRRFGMNYANSDDQQFTLNVMHWLSGLLP